MILRRFAACLLILWAPSAIGAAESADKAEIRWDWTRQQGTTATGVATVGGFDVPLAGTIENSGQIVETPTPRFVPGKNGFLRLRDTGAGSLLTVGGGRAFSAVATVFPEKLGEGRYGHLLCKGRTGAAGRPATNLNYALRLQGKGPNAALSFLFADEAGAFHRWTSDGVIRCDGKAHRIAFTFTFGQPESLRAYLDGVRTAGVWDLAGATDKAPFTDDHDLWIGSAMGGSPGSTFKGTIGTLRFVRGALSEKELTRKPPVVARRPAPRVPAGRVLVEAIDGVPGDARSWSFALPRSAADAYLQSAFAFPQVAHAYGSTGVRTDRGAAFVLRTRGKTVLPPGEWELLIRSRGGARVFLNEEELADVRFFTRSSSAHGKLY
ncbi:MAG: LamG-like jellyroll fold domain-containing protein, partial [Planctomycetota bacterium]